MKRPQFWEMVRRLIPPTGQTNSALLDEVWGEICGGGLGLQDCENQTSSACLLPISEWLTDRYTALHWSTSLSLTLCLCSLGWWCWSWWRWWWWGGLQPAQWLEDEEALNKQLSGYPMCRGLEEEILNAWHPRVCLSMQVKMQNSYFLFWRVPV